MLNRIVTGAHYGLRDWLIQRITTLLENNSVHAL